ncbi:MAG: FAD-binding oxidoreductase [Rhodocyclales bacterium]|nr:FAD-binding oxidoreductase [Rhodocyclales bacterium]
MVAMASWGRLGYWEHDVCALSDRSRVVQQIRGGLTGIAYGMGRSYGDVCLNPGGVLWNTTGLDRFIHFDEASGRLACEAGVLLRDIQQLALPRGWMLPVTPGTQLVTVGGAIANDVHGKNHHVRGSFGDHVHGLTLVRTDGQTLECGPELEPEWFAATVGGLGLTGVIVEAEIQLRRAEGPWLDTETLPYDSLEAFLAMADHSESGWEHTVAWIDCVAGKRGRGVFMRARPGVASARPVPRRRELRVPFAPPVSLVNRWSLRPFNSFYYRLKRRRSGRAVAHYESFFYPLDALHEWNRLYGRDGFYQYQSVVPRDDGARAVRAMLDEIARAGDGSFLAVLKTFGERESPGMLSFPRHGVTLALDFPNRGARTLKLFERLDAIVSEVGGRLYPAKDARMSRAMFEAGYPRLDEFMQFRDPGISSAMSRRLMGS